MVITLLRMVPDVIVRWHSELARLASYQLLTQITLDIGNKK
jgi:hypothetical protein